MGPWQKWVLGPKWTHLISVSCDKSRGEGGVEGGGGLVEGFSLEERWEVTMSGGEWI